MADNTGIFDLHADFISTVSSSVDLSGNLNVRNKHEQKIIRRLHTGEALRSEVGEAPKTAIVGYDYPFTVSSSFVSYKDQKATPPSWTQLNIGLKHGYVLPTLESQHHEVSRLNAFNSGNLPLEQSVIPASASSYYSKINRFVHRIYKLSASYEMPVIPAALDQFPFPHEQDGVRPLFVAASGSYRNHNIFNPSTFEINVNDFGKIRDIKVWVEIVHDVRGGTGVIGPSPAYPKQGLQAIQIALRSPNVSFKYAHPLWNDPLTQDYRKNPDESLQGTYNQFGDLYKGVPALLQNSYLLWAGHSVETDLGVTLGDGTGSVPFYAEWDTDIDMRTIFWDGSGVQNPRHIDRLYANPSEIDPGVSDGTAINSVYNTISALSESSPNAIAHRLQDYNLGYTPGVKGNNVPWFIDPRTRSGSLIGIHNLTGSGVPRGWLTGPGGGIDQGEFPTQGSNIGPENILPVYPLLDDVFVEKVYDHKGPGGIIGEVADVSAIPKDRSTRLIGFRPGLRGTEINGKWQLLIGNAADFHPVNGMVGNARAGYWFRQFRIEFIVDQGSETVTFIPSSARRFLKPAYVPQKPGKRRVKIMSGSAAWDTGVNYVYVEQTSDHGRTIGITDELASAADDFCVFTRITGTLADQLELTGLSALDAYLNNEYRTPYIPLSSGSGETPSFLVFDEEEARISRELFDQVLNPRSLQPKENTTRSVLSRANAVESTRNTLLNKLNALYKK